MDVMSGIIDSSEQDFLRDKLGKALHDALCDYYKSISTDSFCEAVEEGTYKASPWNVLLLYAQRMVANDAVSRFAYQQALSINGAGINVASSNDYAAADTKIIDKGIQSYRREAFVWLNNTLLLLESWAKEFQTPTLVDESDEDCAYRKEVQKIVDLWAGSKYFYIQEDLLIPTCDCLQHYMDLYDNRDKFIRLLPDIRFIQDEYITEMIGEEVVQRLLQSEDDRDKRLLKKTRYFIAACLTERTTVISYDQQTRNRAHDDAVALKSSILSMLQEQMSEVISSSRKEEKEGDGKRNGYENNQPNSRIFVSPLLY